MYTMTKPYNNINTFLKHYVVLNHEFKMTNYMIISSLHNKDELNKLTLQKKR